MNQPKLAKKQDDPMTVSYEANGQMVKLSPKFVQDYLTAGGGQINAQEVVMFINLCKYQRLNPFLREAYLIKYGNQPATIVVGKETFTKRAKRNPDYRGFQAGIIVQIQDTGEIERRTGTFYLPGESVVGGWAKVFVSGWEAPVEAEVAMEEYIGRKKDGEVNSQWRGKPATMIRKVALVQALREAFPEDFTGMYDSAEIEDATSEPLPTTPIPVDDSGAPQEVPDDDQRHEIPADDAIAYGETPTVTEGYDPLA